MVTSKIDKSVIVHTLSGDLSNRDLIDAKQFVIDNLVHIANAGNVLWDMRASNFLRNDAVYAALTRSLINRDDHKTSDLKRAFLVDGSRHMERVRKTLAQSSAPWQWQVFDAYDDALTWLRGERNPT